MIQPNSTACNLLICGIIGPLLFIVVFLIEGSIRSGYNPMRHAVSSLSIGPDGWMQIANFMVSGFLIILGSIGVRRVLIRTYGGLWGPVLIGAVGLGLILAGVFVSDPVYGYPANMPLLLEQKSFMGLAHQRVSGLVFLGCPGACIVFARKFFKDGKNGLAWYCILTCVAMFAAFILAGIGFARASNSFVGIAGLFQRISISIGLIWIAILVGNFLLRRRM